MRKIMLTLIAVSMLASGCKSSEDKIIKPVVLDILYWDKSMFMDTYGSFITMEYPEVELNVIPLKQIFAEANPYEELIKVLESEEPDMMFIQPPQYNYLVQSNRLAPIDALVVKNQDQFNPQVVSKLKFDGTVYGIAPTFTAEMMYLNNSAFESNGIEPPTVPVTWEEWFAIVNRFQSGQNELFGIALEGGTPWSAILQFGTMQGLKFVDHQNRILLATPEWNRVANAVISSIEGGSMQVGSSLDPIEGDAFLRQESAIAFQTDTYRTRIESKIFEGEPFKWSSAPLPISSNGTIPFSPILLEQIAAIPAASKDREAAMTVLSFLMGDGMARVYRERGLLTTRIPTGEGGEWEQIKYLYQSTDESGLKAYGDIMESIPEDIRQQLASAGDQAINEVLAGIIDVDEALTRIEASFRQE